MTFEEYNCILHETTKIVNHNKSQNQSKHSKKLDRDINSCQQYIPWQTHFHFKKLNKRRSMCRKKAPRVSSRKMKRRNIRQAAPTTSDNSENTVPLSVINLTSIKLSKGHFGIFSKGPKFVPTPKKADFSEFQQDFFLWKNRLRWAYYHENKPLNYENIPATIAVEPNDDVSVEMKFQQIESRLIKRDKSKYSAPINKSFALELFIQKLEEDIKNHKEKNSLGDNLSKEERDALQDIRQWKDKIVRPYDKGTGFVIDYTESYKSRVKAELSNPLIYSVVENTEDAISQINNRIKDWIDKYPQEMSPELQEWVIDDKAEFGYFYLNYKAHKPEKITLVD